MTTTTSPEPEDKFDLVSSLYGPGTLVAWYLTIISVLISWTIHPRKRKSDSVDVDLVAVLLLPIVAAGHLISQIQSLLHNSSTEFELAKDDFKLTQFVAAIEASFNVTESFLTICVMLFMIAGWTFCIKRGALVMLVGLFCFATECYAHFSSFRDLGLRYEPKTMAGQSPMFSRSFVADFTGLIVAILVTLLVCAVTGTAFLLIMTIQRGRVTENTAQESENNERSFSRPEWLRRWAKHATNAEQRISEDRYFRFITVISLIFLPVALVVSVIPPVLDSANHKPVGASETAFQQVMKQYILRLGKGLIPRSSCSIMDLDQAVAAFAGATGLGFRFYSAMNEHYRFGKDENVSTRSTRD